MSLTSAPKETLIVLLENVCPAVKVTENSKYFAELDVVGHPVVL